MTNHKPKLPQYFKPLFWSYDFSSIDPQEHKRAVIVNSLNYGNLEHWRWLVKTYGKREVKRFVENIPASEFRKSVLKLVSLIFGIKNFKYATRSDYIKAKKNI